MSVPPIIQTTTRLDAERGLLYVLGYPCNIAPPELEDRDEDGTWHNCDAMGCGSFGAHTLAIVRLWDPITPEDRARTAALRAQAIDDPAVLDGLKMQPSTNACICDHNPETTDGPDIDCPIHGGSDGPDEVQP
jgi:hypothetical protein